MKWFPQKTAYSHALLLLITIILLLSGVPAQAESAYVGETIQITLRRGPGLDFKVLDMLPSGRKVQIVRKEKAWTQVRLTNNKEGWVLSRFLTPEEPSSSRLRKVEAQHKTLSEQTKALIEQNSAVNAENRRLRADLNRSQTNLSDLKQFQTDYEGFKKEFDKLKADKKSLQKQVATTRKLIERYEKATPNVLLTQDIKWFLAGAGVFLFGLIIGLVMRRRRRKSSLLD